MKTELMLLIKTDGDPTMPIDMVAKLLGIEVRTLENRIYAQTTPFTMFKLGTKWVAHVTDVAKHIDDQREAALAPA